MTRNYQKICSSFIKDLPQRTTDVVERRFGLKTGKRETLEAIGGDYGITRERVRQIEEEGFSKIRPKIKEYQKTFQEFNDILRSFGDLKREGALLSSLGGEKFQNHAFFLLTLGEGFERFSENKEFYPFWVREKGSVALAKKVIGSTLKKLEEKKTPFPLEKLFKIQKASLLRLNKKINKNILLSYIEISKKIEKNPEGRFGLRDWVEINPRGVKDKAYLVLKKEGNPLHFTKVAVLIEGLPFPSSQRKTHVATVHNELIKDERFVLVGRGLYALKEWGYAPGMVRDVIVEVLRKAKGPLSGEKILKKVLEQRFVKENTISLNLQDKSYFLRDSQGRYTIKEA